MAELVDGRVKVLTRTDPPWYCREAPQHTYYSYGQFSGKLVGNYENSAYAQPVKDWRPTTFKCTIDLLEEEIQAGLGAVIWADLPIIWGPSL